MTKLLVLAFLALLLPTARTQAADNITLRLDWFVNGFHTPFFLAVDKGYYADEGLTVDIEEGKGSTNTVQLVGNGNDAFGWADAATAAISASRGVPVKVVMGGIRKSPVSLALPFDSPIATPQELKGKTIMSCPGNGALLFLPAYLKAVGLDPLDVKVVNVDCTAIWPLVAQAKADAATGYTPGMIANFARVGIKKIRHFDYADAGLILPSHGVVTSDRLIAQNPDLVRRFVAASVRAWKETRLDPKAAVAATIRQRPQLHGQEDILEEDLVEDLKYIDTPGTAGKPFGWQSPEEWKAAEAIMVKFVGTTPASSTDIYFTNQFVPLQ
jgi:NitT/TauT family transport system substrate-binding protein